MWKYKKTDKVDVGAGYGVLEYDFFTINGKEEFLSLMDYYRNLWERFDYFLDGCHTIKNNTGLSQNVQAKMKEHNANLCLTFLEEECKENNIQIRKMVVNEQKLDGTYDTSSFYFYVFKNSVKIYIKQALTYEEEGFYGAAIECYSELIKLIPNIAPFYECRGKAYAKRDNYDSAIEDFTQAIKIDPNYVPAYINRSRAYAYIAYAHKGSYDMAIADCTQAIQLDPNSSKAYCNRGAALANKGSYAEAFIDFAKAIELDPDDEYVYIDRGEIYQDKGDYDSAKADFLKALEINPNNKLAKKRLGALKKEIGEKE
jgi:tetratricopeptide (TPR) repeat protein